jgi:SAM-dependent methyltransferase
MYGYSDYDGPNVAAHSSSTDAVLTTNVIHPDRCNYNSNIGSTTECDVDDECDNPLQVGFWMEGDSLAPPCGTSISTVHKILHFLQVTANDTLYDLGCGDGRICLEAWHLYQCTAIGIEIEADLVARAEALIAKISQQRLSLENNHNHPRVHCMDLRQLFAEWRKDAGASNKPIFPLPTIIFLYLLPEALLEIKSDLSYLLTIAPDCRIVCNTWGIPHWKPIQETTISETSAAGVSTTIYIYTQQSLRNDPVQCGK